MKLLVALALALACTAVPAQSAAADKRVENFTPAQSPRPAKLPERQRRPSPSVSVAFTDDADSILLPAFASRTTPTPMRFLRVGVEWAF